MNYPMRKSNKEITEKSALETIIKESLVCRLALVDGNRPYIVPLNFGYQDNTLYFHSAPEGKKIDIIKTNTNVCFEFEANTEIIKAEQACGWSMNYQSVIGFGKAYLIEDAREKCTALNIIMQHYSGSDFSFPESKLQITAVFKVEIERMTGKQSGQ
jgi:nitroimidazol reductase NimA-like FMN-containing flavoprotein (pyridoxamine 5'-phosphate oxidase superfamily)